MKVVIQVMSLMQKTYDLRMIMDTKPIFIKVGVPNMSMLQHRAGVRINAGDSLSFYNKDMQL